MREFQNWLMIKLVPSLKLRTRHLYSQKVPLCVILNTQKSEEQQNLHPIKNFWLLAQGDFNYMLEIRDQFYDSVAESYSALLLNVTTIWNVNHKVSPGILHQR